MKYGRRTTNYLHKKFLKICNYSIYIFYFKREKDYKLFIKNFLISVIPNTETKVLIPLLRALVTDGLIVARWLTKIYSFFFFVFPSESIGI